MSWSGIRDGVSFSLTEEGVKEVGTGTVVSMLVGGRVVGRYQKRSRGSGRLI